MIFSRVRNKERGKAYELRFFRKETYPAGRFPDNFRRYNGIFRFALFRAAEGDYLIRALVSHRYFSDALRRFFLRRIRRVRMPELRRSAVFFKNREKQKMQILQKADRSHAGKRPPERINT